MSAFTRGSSFIHGPLGYGARVQCTLDPKKDLCGTGRAVFTFFVRYVFMFPGLLEGVSGVLIYHVLLCLFMFLYWSVLVISFSFTRIQFVCCLYTMSCFLHRLGWRLEVGDGGDLEDDGETYWYHVKRFR